MSSCFQHYRPYSTLNKVSLLPLLFHVRSFIKYLLFSGVLPLLMLQCDTHAESRGEVLTSAASDIHRVGSFHEQGLRELRLLPRC
jgi:hypothetical protein